MREQSVSRRRQVRARVGVLEDVRGAAGGPDWPRRIAMSAAWERFIDARHLADALSVQEIRACG